MIATVALLPLALGADSPVPLIVALGVAGVGFGLASASLQTAAIEAVPAGDTGVASGVFAMGRYAGAIAGSVALGAVLVETDTAVTGFQALAGLIVGAAALSALVSLRIDRSTHVRPDLAETPTS